MSEKYALPKKSSDEVNVKGQKSPALRVMGKIMDDVDLINPISEIEKLNIIKSTQKSIDSIHRSTVEYTSVMIVKNAEAIASIGIAHESKASEAIEAIERMNESGLKSLRIESISAKKSIIGSALLAIGGIGSALAIFRK